MIFFKMVNQFEAPLPELFILHQIRYDARTWVWTMDTWALHFRLKPCNYYHKMVVLDTWTRTRVRYGYLSPGNIDLKVVFLG